MVVNDGNNGVLNDVVASDVRGYKTHDYGFTNTIRREHRLNTGHEAQVEQWTW